MASSPLLTLGQQDDEEDEDGVAEGLESHLAGLDMGRGSGRKVEMFLCVIGGKQFASQDC